MKQDSSFDVSKWDDKCMQAFIVENAAVFRVFAKRYITDGDVVDDILQEAYIKFWSARHKIGIVESPRNYFFSIIKNTIIDKRAYFSPAVGERIEEKHTDISDNGIFFQHILEAETSELIARAVMSLSQQSRNVIRMTLEGQPMADIADALGVTVNTVKTIKYRALKRLSELLSHEDFLSLLALLCLSLEKMYVIA